MMNRLAATLIAVASLAFASAANAEIVPGKGIAGISLGQTQAKVHDVAGEPLHVARRSDEFGKTIIWSYLRLNVDFRNGKRVTTVTSFSRTERTALDIGVGSTEAQLVEAYPSATCRTEPAGGKVFRSCFLSRGTSPGPITAFAIRGSRVDHVQVTRPVVVR